MHSQKGAPIAAMVQRPMFDPTWLRNAWRVRSESRVASSRLPLVRLFDDGLSKAVAVAADNPALPTIAELDLGTQWKQRDRMQQTAHGSRVKVALPRRKQQLFDRFVSG